MNKKNYVAIEAPDNKATVDILDTNTSIEITVDRQTRKIRLLVKSSIDPSDSEWKQDDIEVSLPEIGKEAR